MKELTPIEEKPKLITLKPSKRRKTMKKWKTKVCGFLTQRELNRIRTRIWAYDKVIKQAKVLLLKPGDVYFERDYREDDIDPFSVHSLLTPTFYFDIHCDLCLQVIVHYQFQDCPHEEEIRALFNTDQLIESCSPPPKVVDLPAFLQRVIAYQKPEFIHTL